MTAETRLWLPLGELLVEHGLLSQRQLELALEEHRRSGRRLGEVLVAFGFVSTETLTSTLLEQVGGLGAEPVEEVAEEEPDHEVAEAEPEIEPVIVRLDAENEGERRRWWSRGPSESRVAELERALQDFERRSREIQANIVEIRATLRTLHNAR